MTPSVSPSTTAFNDEQKEFLSRLLEGMPLVPELVAPAAAREPETLYGIALEDLSKEERIKLERHGLDIWETLAANADAGRFPQGDDIFRYKFHGLFYVAPAQNALMCRLRLPACEISAHQLRGVADIAERFGGGYADITTRGNLQIREIPAHHAVDVLIALAELGITSKGSGADNVRNITASPTSGFDPQELYDVRPLAKALHHQILNSRELYGLPRKFNVAFDSGGAISVAADTNDIAFIATRVAEGNGLPAGIYFRVQLGGITGHRTFAQDCGLLLTPEQTVPTAVAMISVFIENADRTNRKKARLKYLLEKWGIDRFLQEAIARLPFIPSTLALEACAPRPPVHRGAHVGLHPQRQHGLSWIGVGIPVGRMTADQMRGLSQIAGRRGSGDIRLTVYQNAIIPNVASRDVEAARAEIMALGFHVESSLVSGGFVACTGSRGCRYAAADTKGDARTIAAYLQDRVTLDLPLNVHVTGCAHSCAQHYCGDIGLIATRVQLADGATVDGYNVMIGGGMDHEQGLARELVKNVPATEVPMLLEQVLNSYLQRRLPGETFIAYARRHQIPQLLETLTDCTAPEPALPAMEAPQ